MLTEARRDHLVLWLENRWARQTVEARAILLSMEPRMRGIVAGHEALGGLEEHECANAIEVVERFYKGKIIGDWKDNEKPMQEVLRSTEKVG